MKVESISNTERVVITRSGNNSVAQYQVKDPVKGWKTEARETYGPDWRGKVVEDITEKYQNQERRAKEYNQSKSKPYH